MPERTMPNHRHLIAGRSQLLSKRSDQFAPGVWPESFTRARGSRVVSADGSHFVDMSISGIGANILGYSPPRVIRKLSRALRSGWSTSLNPVEEIELAEKLLELDSWADSVRYARSGGESMAIAVRLARAATGRDFVLFSGYHGWHDWYLAANLLEPNALAAVHIKNLQPLGVPTALKGTSQAFLPFDIEDLRTKVAAKKGRVAAIVLEPARLNEPPPGFLEQVREISQSEGAVLIFDEISSGFRFEFGGIHKRYGTAPDIAVYSKALSNGVPMAAITGRASVMSAVEKSFVSSTHWSERLGPVAALAVFSEFETRDIPGELNAIGEFVANSWMEAASQVDFEVEVSGFGGIRYLHFKEDDARRSTALTVEMLKRGVLHGPRFYANVEQGKHLRKFHQKLCSSFASIRYCADKGQLPSDSETRASGFVPFKPGAKSS